MRIAVPTETKNSEHRVAITPSGVAELTHHGHEVFVQAGAGVGSLITDEDYRAAGATILDTAAETWERGEMVLKVKEPLLDEYRYLREDLLLFTYLHLAADRPQTEALLQSECTAMAYETVQRPDRSLPLLYPMSEVAGCLAPQVGTQFLMKPRGGMGVMLGGIAGVAMANVVILGAGTVGQNAAQIAVGLGAKVTILDTDLDKLRAVYWQYGGRVQGLVSNKMNVREQVIGADLVIGTVLVPGARTPKLVSNDMVAQMKPGSVLVDVAIDQGGCFEDSRPTTHEDPVFQVHGSTFYCVGNMPGAVPNTSTYALTNATLPYVMQLADAGWQQACKANPVLAHGLNVHAGHITHEGVAAAFEDLPYEDVLAEL